MTKLLVTGVSGFVGRHLVKELKLHNIHVVCAGRNKPISMLDEFYLVTDFNDSSAWQKPLVGCDVVIHLAARVHVMREMSQNPLDEFRKVNVKGTLALANNATQAGVKRFIYISSLKVNGEFSTENIPFSENDIPNPQDAYGVSKLEAEQGLMQLAKQTNMEIVIIRPPLVYGVGVKANFLRMLQLVRRGIPLPFGAVKNKRSFVYLENLVSLILCCIKHPAAANQLFLVSDGYDLSTPELIVNLAKALGVKSRLIPINQKIIEYTAKVIGKKNLAQRLCGNLQVDITKARQLLNWEPPYTVEEGLKKTVSGMTHKVDVS
jgi:nucleoside-diphosphate-sugar epimerase